MAPGVHEPYGADRGDAGSSRGAHWASVLLEDCSRAVEQMDAAALGAALRRAAIALPADALSEGLVELLADRVGTTSREGTPPVAAGTPAVAPLGNPPAEGAEPQERARHATAVTGTRDAFDALDAPRTRVPAETGDWGGWEKVAAPRCISGPAATSSAPHRLDCFVVGADSAIYYNERTGSSWGDRWDPIGGPTLSTPAVVSPAVGRIELFFINVDHALCQQSWDGVRWSESKRLDGPAIYGVAATAAGPWRVDCFVVGVNSRMFHRSWNGVEWGDWWCLGGPLYSAPAAVARAPDRLDVFAVAENRTLSQRSCDGGRWSGWTQVGVLPLRSAAAVAACGADRLECLALGLDSVMQHNTLASGRWAGWRPVVARCTHAHAPAIVSQRADRLDALAIGMDNLLYQNRWA